jgi:hypothetical protein
LELQLLALQDLHDGCDRRNALSRLRFTRCAKLVVSIGLIFVGSFAEHMFHTFAELRFSFRLGGIAIWKSLLAEIIDGGKHLLQPAYSGFDFFERDRFGKRLRIVCCMCTCHSDVKKV